MRHYKLKLSHLLKLMAYFFFILFINNSGMLEHVSFREQLFWPGYAQCHGPAGYGPAGYGPGSGPGYGPGRGTFFYRKQFQIVRK